MAYNDLPSIVQNRLKKDPSYRYKRDRLIAIGGREWAKGITHRIYLSRASALKVMGAEVKWGNGKITSASLDGDPFPVSNAETLYNMADCGIYYDLGKNSWGSNGLSDYGLQLITPRLNEFFGL